MEVTKVYEVIEYHKQPCFKEFGDLVSEARRDGDKDKDLEVIASTMKLIGNSGYGSLIMDKEKHLKIWYKDNIREAQIKVNDKRFRNLEELDGGEIFEIHMAKSSINLNLPIQLGYFILQYAKLHMLSFYYDFMMEYIDYNSFEYLQMDTDSAYMAISSNSIYDIIKGKYKEEYLNSINNMCNEREILPGMYWFPRECCQLHKNYDKRTPGLFKVEFEGEEMIGLCSKTYIASKKDELKISCKGINKKLLNNPMEIYKNVIHNKISTSSINKGFQIKK